MILQVKELKDAATKILASIDNGSMLDKVKDTLEIVSANKVLQLNVTNKEYYVRVKVPLLSDENFRALVDAKLFLNLISKTTVDEVELKTTQTSLIVKANGTYKLPFIYDGNDVINLPEIKIENKTMEFNISSDALNSIANINSKEIDIAAAKRDYQKVYYIDEQGCLTFSSGACMNHSFTLPEKVILLLNDKTVKLLKLFKTGDVKFSLGMDAYGNQVLTKVKFENDDIEVTAITPTSQALIDSVSTRVSRARATLNKKYANVVYLDKNELLEAIARLLVYSYAIGGLWTDYAYLSFDPVTGLTITSNDKNSKEQLPYLTNEGEQSHVVGTYNTIMDIKQLKTTLSACEEDAIQLRFDDHQGMLLLRKTIFNFVPEADVTDGNE